MAALDCETTSFDVDWVHSTFETLNKDHMILDHEKWQSFDPSQTYALPPSLASQASIERYGQVTPPDELSPASPPRDYPLRDYSSPPKEQASTEVTWAPDHFDFFSDLTPESQLSQPQSAEPPMPQGVLSASDSNSATDSTPSTAANTISTPQAPKRKRGRPKSQPQPPPADAAQDGFPYPVTSARQTHLEKNRLAAHKCRQRKKEYIGDLETRAREYSTKNKLLKDQVAILRDEVLTLKNEVLRHANCASWRIDEYLNRCAGDLLGVDNSAFGRPSQSQSQTRAVPPPASEVGSSDIKMSIASAPLSPDGQHNSAEEFEGLQLLKDFTEDDDMLDDGKP